MLCCNWSQEMPLSSRMRKGGPNLGEGREGKEDNGWNRKEMGEEDKMGKCYRECKDRNNNTFKFAQISVVI